MDPNANLAEQESLIRRTLPSERQRMAELRHALSDWLRRGGFEPAWASYPAATRAFQAWQRNWSR